MFLQFSNKKQKADSLNNTGYHKRLIEEYRQSGNTGLIAELFDHFIHLVYGVCMKYLKNEDSCNDAVMDIFETVLIDLKSYEVDNFKNWLYIVSKNYCLRQKRIRKQNNRFVEYTKKGISISIMETEDKLALEIDGTKEQQEKSLYKALEQLRTEQRRCIELFYLQQKSYKETVEITGYEMRKVKSYIQNGKRNLQIALSKLNEFKDER